MSSKTKTVSGELTATQLERMESSKLNNDSLARSNTQGKPQGLKKLASHPAVDVLHRCTIDQGGKEKHFSLEDYAKAKKLPIDFLKSLGLATSKYRGQTRVKIQYYDETGEPQAIRWRVGKDKWWAKGHGPKIRSYGLWRLAEMKKAGYLILVEGESDCHTLWHYSLPPIGLPGAVSFKPEWQTFFEGIRVYAWQEPGKGGETFIKRADGYCHWYLNQIV